VRVNGEKVLNMVTLARAVRDASGPWITFEFDSEAILVLPLEPSRAATGDILRTHSIPAPMSSDLVAALASGATATAPPERGANGGSGAAGGAGAAAGAGGGVAPPTPSSVPATPAATPVAGGGVATPAGGGGDDVHSSGGDRARSGSTSSGAGGGGGGGGKGKGKGERRRSSATSGAGEVAATGLSIDV
jgi:hypothetical protein